MKPIQLNTEEEVKAFLTGYAQFMKEKYRPALDVFLPDTFERSAVQYTLEHQATVALNEAAIEEGFESAAHKYLSEKEEEAKVAAKAKAIEEQKKRAIELKERAELEALAEAEIAKQKARDEEDAKEVAKLKAEVQARNLAEKQSQFNN